jgi:hypothetical protein
LRKLENRVLRRIFGPKEDEMLGGWRKLHNEEPHKSRKMRWVGYVACTGRRGIQTGFWWESPKE